MENRINEIVENEYKAYGANGKATSIQLSDKRISVFINSEVPYIGSDFFKFLETLRNKLEDILKEDGYSWNGGKFYYDFYIMEFTKK